MSNTTLRDSQTSQVIAKERSQVVTKVQTLRIVIDKSPDSQKPQEKVTSPPTTTKIARRRLARAIMMEDYANERTAHYFLCEYLDANGKDLDITLSPSVWVVAEPDAPDAASSPPAVTSKRPIRLSLNYWRSR